jgi:NAD(P)-dependent dehydrogenase (short-subunit alcohol dehydrogenase family)
LPGLTLHEWGGDMLNKRIIVTGGTYGIGASVVAALAAENATVACMARSADLGQRQAAELSAKGPGTVKFFRCDVSVRPEVKSAFAAAVADMGGLDALVHVAGVESGAKPEEETDAAWDYVFDINAKGTFITNQEAFPYLKDKGGRILNFGSGSGITGMPVNAAYSASKGAVAAWTRSVAQAWGRYNITVNVICPAVWTPMYDEHRARYSAEELRAHDAAMARMVHIGGKLGDPDSDLAPVIIFLCSDGARFLTGQTYCVDGGALMVR